MLAHDKSSAHRGTRDGDIKALVSSAAQGLELRVVPGKKKELPEARGLAQQGAEQLADNRPIDEWLRGHPALRSLAGPLQPQPTHHAPEETLPRPDFTPRRRCPECGRRCGTEEELATSETSTGHVGCASPSRRSTDHQPHTPAETRSHDNHLPWGTGQNHSARPASHGGPSRLVRRQRGACEPSQLHRDWRARGPNMKPLSERSSRGFKPRWAGPERQSGDRGTDAAAVGQRARWDTGGGRWCISAGGCAPERYRVPSGWRSIAN